jgi:hypothetical protein
MAAENETRGPVGEPAATVRVQPRVDYDNGEYGNGIARKVPMDPASGTAMGQPDREDSL